ncbi:MAG: TonB-dependent receptor [Vicinamibacterales bacterium]
MTRSLPVPAALVARIVAAVLAGGLVALPAPGLAQGRPPDLSQVSIEELMNIEVTAAGRKEQRATDVAAAVYVITNDDIRRSGMTTIPDLLRLAPGVDVAQINSNKWSVSVRGFNGLFANKLLVLVDGRSTYNRLFSGVIWEAQDLMLDDIERIEVIRGPGAAMWGANAVNGVINIITKTSLDTQGGLVRADAGRMGVQAAVRYGGAVGAVHYRVFAQGTGRDQSLVEPGTRADDRSHSVAAGFRTDWARRPGAFVVEGAFTSGHTRGLWLNFDPVTAADEPLVRDPSDATDGHLLARWTHTGAGGATLQVQSFVDFADRREPVGHYSRHAFDFDTQYHTALGAHQDVVFGGSYRFVGEALVGRNGFSLTPPDDDDALWTAFFQDEIAAYDNRLAVTFGAQVQHDTDSGTGVQPTARVMWKVHPRQRLWAATSRALRTPSLADRGLRLDYPPVPGPGGLPLVVRVLGNPAASTETFVDVEAGYRLEATVASIDVTGFAGHYGQLQTQEPGAPVVEFVPSPRILVTAQFGNLLEATTRGIEVAARWTPLPTWHLDGSYTAFALTPHLAAASLDPKAAAEDGSSPRQQWQLESVWSPDARATLAVALFHVGRLEQLQVAPYTRADITAEWRFTKRLSVMAIGQNLFDAAHAEFGATGSLLLGTQVPRSASVRVRWTLP